MFFLSGESMGGVDLEPALSGPRTPPPPCLCSVLGMSEPTPKKENTSAPQAACLLHVGTFQIAYGAKSEKPDLHPPCRSLDQDLDWCFAGIRDVSWTGGWGRGLEPELPTQFCSRGQVVSPRRGSVSPSVVGKGSQVLASFATQSFVAWSTETFRWLRLTRGQTQVPDTAPLMLAKSIWLPNHSS